MNTKLFNCRIDENLLETFDNCCKEINSNKTAIITQLIEMFVNGSIDLNDNNKNSCKDAVKTTCKDSYNTDKTSIIDLVKNSIKNNNSQLIENFNEELEQLEIKLMQQNAILNSRIDSLESKIKDLTSNQSQSLLNCSDLVTINDITPTPDHDIVQNQQQQQNLLTANDLIGLGVESNKNTLNTWLRRGKIPKNQSLSDIYSITSQNSKNYFIKKTC